MSVVDEPSATSAGDDPAVDANDAGPAAQDDDLASLLARLAAPPRRARPILFAKARVGPFVVQELLGRGGMGEVWRAVDTRLARTVALKVLRRSAHDSALLDEARAAAAVQHARVATLYEVGEAEGPAGRLGYIALELVPGETLRGRLRGGALPVAQVLAIVSDCAEGLAAVHLRGLVHRDIKPDNLALDEHGRVKLLDFGLATRAGADVATWGTPRYLPPEQRRGDEVDARADLFALGVTAIELLTGSAPFDDEGALRAELQGDALAQVRALPGVPRALIALLARCVAQDPAARPDCAAVVARELALLTHPRATARARATPWALVGLAGALSASLLSLATRVEDAVSLGLPPALASAPQVSRDPRVDARFRAAADAMLAGDDATASAALAEVLEAEPGIAWAWALLLVAGDPQRAGRNHPQALDQVRRLADAGTREGRAALALAALADARTLIDAQPIAPNHPAVALGLAALEEAGTDAFTAVLLAALLPWHERPQERLDRLDAALSRDAQVARSWAARADTLTRAERHDEAARDARLGLARVPGNAALEDALLRARITPEGALEVERELHDRLRARPDDLDARLLLVEVARARGELALARAQVERLLVGPFARAPVGQAAARLALTEPSARGLLPDALAALDEAGLTALADSARAKLDAQPR